MYIIPNLMLLGGDSIIRINNKIIMCLVLILVLLGLSACDIEINPNKVDQETTNQLISNEFILTLITKVGAFIGMVVGVLLIIFGVRGDVIFEIELLGMNLNIDTSHLGLVIFIISAIIFLKSKQKIKIKNE